MTNPLFAIYCDATHQPGLQHETLTIEQRKHWIGWTITAHNDFRAIHPDCFEPKGGVKPEHHATFVDFCRARDLSRRTA
jgi:hypothetical protein